VSQEHTARPRRVSLIVAMDRQRVIGNQGKLPWHIPEDLKRFKALTMGHSIIMGRKTHESIGRLLPGRRSIIVTRQERYAVPGALIVHSIEEALAACAGEAEAFVIGGAEIYREAITCADRIYVTEVHGDYAGDTHFPELSLESWREVAREDAHPTAAGAPAISYVTLARAGAEPN
jgi:dihydrofolate reductase